MPRKRETDEEYWARVNGGGPYVLLFRWKEDGTSEHRWVKKEGAARPLKQGWRRVEKP